MSSIKHKINTMLKTPRIFWIKFSHSRIFKYLPDKLALSIMFKNTFYRKINWKNPRTFNEKMQYLKIYNRKPEYSIMVDKYEVKKYAASIIGKEYIVPTLGVWDTYEEIDFGSLPNEFVLKCTHGSGDVVICKDKKTFDYRYAKEKLTKALKMDFFKVSREWPYKNVKKRIIAEPLLKNSGDSELRDYKFFCFNGIPRFYKVDFDRFSCHRANYYDLQSNLLEIGEIACPPDKKREYKAPPSIYKMKELATLLSQDTYFLRTDFYDINGKVFLGELTFFPAGGFGLFVNEESDYQLGDMINLSTKK